MAEMKPIKWKQEHALFDVVAMQRTPVDMVTLDIDVMRRAMRKAMLEQWLDLLNKRCICCSAPAHAVDH